MSVLSYSGTYWSLPVVDESRVMKLCQAHGLPEMVARLLIGRNVGLTDVDSFMRPRLSQHFPDPFTMRDMDKAASRLADAIQKGEKIGVIADFDVDGATSGAILTRVLRHFGAEPFVYIPDRIKDGYGPNNRYMERLKNDGCTLILTLDCGITSKEPLAFAAELGMDAIILDHHEPEGDLPIAYACVNPKRHDDASGLSMMAACGVTFLAVVALQAEMKKRGSCPSEFPMKNLLELVALGTVCDMVPLTGCNRLFVKYGLPMIGQGHNPGLVALCQVAGIKGVPNLMHLGFALGPRINAGSRVHESALGYQMLSTVDHTEALNIAWLLNDCNDQRKGIEKIMLEQALVQVEEQKLRDDPIIVVDHEEWHVGLSGLVAGRIKERTGKPAACIAYVSDGGEGLEGRGSGRSLPGLNMAGLFQAARADGVLIRGGGHAMAGGFTICPTRVVDFKSYARTHALSHSTVNTGPPQRVVDCVASLRSAQPEVVRLLEDTFGPYGQGHTEPLFALQGVRVDHVDVLKDAHIRLNLVDATGGRRLKCMMFRGVGTEAGAALLKAKGECIDVVGRFVLNEWQGRVSAEMHVEDAGPMGMIGGRNEILALAS